MSLRFSDEVRNAICDGAATLFDGGFIRLYTGTPPANLSDSPGGILLSTIPLNNPAFTSAVSGVADISMLPALVGNVNNTGTVGFFKILDSSSNPIMDGVVAASGGDMTIDRLDFQVGSIIAIASMQITAG